MKFDADYMSIQEGQAITARNELLLLTVLTCCSTTNMSHVPTASVAPEIVTTLH